MFQNLTLGQKIAMMSVALSALAGATAQLTPIMGGAAATAVASLCSLANTIVSGWIFIVTGQQQSLSQVQNTVGGQEAIVRSVLAMPGVSKVDVNTNASPELAKLAVDPNVDKIAPTPEAVSVVLKTAEAAKP